MTRFPINVQDGVLVNISNIKVYPEQLTFTYDVSNHSPFRIYLVNQLFHRRGSAGFQVDANLVYAEIYQDSILYLQKQLIEVPEELDVEAPEVPYVTPVDAGSSYDETLTFRLPIFLHNPYRYQSDTNEQLTISKFTFFLGYLVEDDSIRVSEVTLPSGVKHLRIDFVDLMIRQRLKEIGPFQASILVTT